MSEQLAMKLQLPPPNTIHSFFCAAIAADLHTSWRASLSLQKKKKKILIFPFTPCGRGAAGGGSFQKCWTVVYWIIIIISFPLHCDDTSNTAMSVHLLSAKHVLCLPPPFTRSSYKQHICLKGAGVHTHTHMHLGDIRVSVAMTRRGHEEKREREEMIASCTHSG